MQNIFKICQISSRYAKYLQVMQNITAMCEIFPIIIISAQYAKISPQHAKINSTISSPLSSPLLKFNDGPILFLLLQRRLLLETLWTTADYNDNDNNNNINNIDNNDNNNIDNKINNNTLDSCTLTED